MKKTKAVKGLDKAIEQAYYRNCKGRQIDIMKINKLYAFVKEKVAEGADLESAVIHAIEIFTEPA